MKSRIPRMIDENRIFLVSYMGVLHICVCGEGDIGVHPPPPTMVSFPKNHANTKKLNAKLSSNKKKCLKKF